MLMMILLYFNLKVADVSLSESGHLAPSWLTGHMNGFFLPLQSHGGIQANLICGGDK